MLKKLFNLLTVPFVFCALSGFNSTSEKPVSTAVVYCVTAVLSACVFLIYTVCVKKKSPWFILLFSSVQRILQFLLLSSLRLHAM